jgi:phenylacetate-CoA ligase
VEEVERRIRREIENIIGISVGLKLCEPKSLPRFEGKSKRVIDRRKR